MKLYYIKESNEHKMQICIDTDLEIQTEEWLCHDGHKEFMMRIRNEF